MTDETLEAPPGPLRTTIVLAVLVVGLFAFYKVAPFMTSDERPYKAERVFPYLEVKAVHRAELTAGGRTVVLARAPAAEQAEAAKKDDDGHGHDPKAEAARPWRVEAPVADLADDDEVFRVLNALEFLEFETKLEGDKAKEIAFGEPVARVRLERAKGEAIAFELGQEDLGKRALRVDGQPDVVYLIKPGKLHEDLAQEPWRFRKKQLFELTRDLVHEVTLTVAPEQAGPGVAPREVALRKHDGHWRLGGPDGEFVDDVVVNELLTDAYGLRALEGVVDTPSHEDLARLGLEPARATLTLVESGKDGAAGRRQELVLGTPVEGKADHRHGRFTDRTLAFTVDAGALRNELERPLEDWASDALVVVRGEPSTLSGFAVAFDDGTTWGITQGENRTWTFDGKGKEGAPVIAASAQVEALLGDVLRLEALARAPGPHDLKALGLDPPQVKLAVVQGTLRRELHLGAPVPGAPGVHHVARPGEARVFTARIDALVGRLRDAPLELLDKVVFKASEWEAKKLVVVDPEGKTTFEAVGAGEVREWKVTTPPSPDAASDRVRELVARFKEVKVDRWAAADSPEARRQAGLDRPTKVVVTVETFKDGKPTDVERVLLLGRREGDRVHAMAEGGVAIGRIDATFLDVIARGFAKGTTILESDRWDAKGLVVKDGDQVVLELQKPAENWLRTDGGARQILETTEVEDLLQNFERVEVTRAEPRADARLAEVGLSPPRRTITLTLRKGEGTETRTLLVGERAGAREVWATSEGAGSFGVLFDEALRELDAWCEEHQPPSQFPPVDAPQDGQQGARPPAPPGEASCATCSVTLPGGGPFTFRDPTPPHRVYETCSVGHLDELKQTLAARQGETR